MNEVEIHVQLWRRGFHSDVLITEQKAVQTAKDIFMHELQTDRITQKQSILNKFTIETKLCSTWVVQQGTYKNQAGTVRRKFVLPT